jgi:hypothetical protein
MDREGHKAGVPGAVDKPPAELLVQSLTPGAEPLFQGVNAVAQGGNVLGEGNLWENEPRKAKRRRALRRSP